MPKPFQHDDDYDSDPEIQAEKEMAKKDPVGFSIDSNSLTSQKKAAAAKEEVSTTPPNLVIAAAIAGNGRAGSISSNTRSSSEDEIAKKPKGSQSKALKKERSRGISGCYSRKYAGYDDDMDFEEDDAFDEDESYYQDEEATYIKKK
ncbi:hypothetical protein CAEBREN_23402 [Caenorhabditis brenneri]|uniref:Uncharacterized protein n=1 Tax=Caenorhabditis brenneri TaxID=135651 RepID=G0MTU9_CAEBE|nr:hypothetical protein CAEBREN_23402 [Caenorhabditis brenneri]